MKTTNEMIQYQLKMLNNSIENDDICIIIGNCYGYYEINILYKKTTGQATIRSGLTKKEVYNCLKVANELLYLKSKGN